LQDEGCKSNELENKTYKQSQIPPIGPEESELYYPHLSAIATDLSKTFSSQQELGNGWAKLPKNKINVKVKIIGRLLALRRIKNDGSYALEQERVLDMLQNVWG